jgi:hypothetical protein
MSNIRVIRRWSIAAGGLLIGLAAAAAPAAAQGSAEQRRACAPDAVRLCGEFIPNVEKVTACMTAKKADLSGACRDAMFAAQSGSPVVASSHKKTRVARAERNAKHRAKHAAKSATASCEMAKGHKKYKNCKVVRTRG